MKRLNKIEALHQINVLFENINYSVIDFKETNERRHLRYAFQFIAKIQVYTSLIGSVKEPDVFELLIKTNVLNEQLVELEKKY